MKTMTVCISLLSVGLALCVAHEGTAAARQNRRNSCPACCPPVCATVQSATETPATVAAPLAAVAPIMPVEDAELRAKLIERRDTLKEVVQILEVRDQAAGVSTSILNHAYIDLLEAELPLAKSHADRIVLYEKSLESWSEIEQGTQVMKEVGSVAPEENLKAKADRIKAEIDLHNARKMK